MQREGVPQELLEGLYTHLAVISLGFETVDYTIHGGILLVVAHEEGIPSLVVRCGEVTISHTLAMQIMGVLVDLVISGSDDDYERLRESFEKSWTYQNAGNVVESILQTGTTIPIVSDPSDLRVDDLVKRVRSILA